MKTYECPQHGKDENGEEIHQLMYHVLPFYTLEEAKELLKPENEDKYLEILFK